MRLNNLFELLKWFFTPVKLYWEGDDGFGSSSDYGDEDEGTTDSIGSDDSDSGGDWNTTTFSDEQGKGTVTFNENSNEYNVTYDNGNFHGVDAVGNSYSGYSYGSDETGTYVSNIDYYDTDGDWDSHHTHYNYESTLGTSTMENPTKGIYEAYDGFLGEQGYLSVDISNELSIGIDTDRYMNFNGLTYNTNLYNDVLLNGIDTGLFGALGFNIAKEFDLDKELGTKIGFGVGLALTAVNTLQTFKSAMQMANVGKTLGIQSIEFTGYLAAFATGKKLVDTMVDANIAFGYGYQKALAGGFENRETQTQKTTLVNFQKDQEEELKKMDKALMEKIQSEDIDKRFEWLAGGEFYNARAGSFGYEVDHIDYRLNKKVRDNI